MTFDLGLQGAGILAGSALIFGGAIFAIGRLQHPWLAIVAFLGYVVGGLLASEVVWGKMTVDEIQPIIDGLAFDESLLGGLIGGALATLAAWFASRTRPGGQLAAH